MVKESQRGQNAFSRLRALELTIHHRDRMTTQSQARGGNAARRIRAGVVGHKPIPGIRVVQEIAKCQLLKFQDIVGKKGFPLGKAIMETAAEGNIQSVTYWWPRPGTETPLEKHTFYTKVGDQICGVGYYKQ